MYMVHMYVTLSRDFEIDLVYLGSPIGQICLCYWQTEQA